MCAGCGSTPGVGTARVAAFSGQPLTGSIGVVTINLRDWDTKPEPARSFCSSWTSRCTRQRESGDQAQDLEQFTTNRLYPYMHTTSSVFARFGNYGRTIFPRSGSWG